MARARSRATIIPFLPGPNWNVLNSDCDLTLCRPLWAWIFEVHPAGEGYEQDSRNAESINRVMGKRRDDDVGSVAALL